MTRRIWIIVAVGAAASVAALARPGEAWAPWAVFSDLAADIQQVCKNGTYFHMANVEAPGAPPLPRTKGEHVQAASPAPPLADVDNYQAPDPSTLVTSRSLRLLKRQITFFENDDPSQTQHTKEYNRRFLILWRKRLSPGAEVAFSFDKFGNPEAHRDTVPAHTIANCWVKASRYDDLILGSHRGNSLDGLGRHDRMYGGSGHDKMWGRNGNDVMFGQSGNDLLDGGKGNDYLNGGGGNDRLIGRRGADKMLGGSGNDILYARKGGRDIVNCGRGFDRAYVDSRDRVSRSCEVVLVG